MTGEVKDVATEGVTSSFRAEWTELPREDGLPLMGLALYAGQTLASVSVIDPEECARLWAETTNGGAT